MNYIWHCEMCRQEDVEARRVKAERKLQKLRTLAKQRLQVTDAVKEYLTGNTYDIVNAVKALRVGDIIAYADAEAEASPCQNFVIGILDQYKKGKGNVPWCTWVEVVATDNPLPGERKLWTTVQDNRVDYVLKRIRQDMGLAVEDPYRESYIRILPPEDFQFLLKFGSTPRGLALKAAEDLLAEQKVRLKWLEKQIAEREDLCERLRKADTKVSATRGSSARPRAKA